MSGYHGRRAPNFSQYLDDLNTIPSPYDQAMQQQQQQQDAFNLDAELALFTNTEFLDFDNLAAGNISGNVSVNYDPAEDELPSKGHASVSKGHDMKYVDLLNGDFGNAQQYPGFSPPMVPMHGHAGYPSATHPHTAATNSSHHHGHTNAGNPNGHGGPGSDLGGLDTTSPISVSGDHAAQAGLPSGSDSGSTPHTLEDASRIAAEEDKRRRNTAASARFRVKKKQREQALERTVKEVTEKNSVLENRVSQLEMENRWLKNLITEKNGTVANDNDVSEMLRKFRENEEAYGRKPSQSKKGVGTSS
ncbi:hypothetical protein FQN54_007277 [Arachnomyces sp. PD_36]|nr:hypothetical protein FQN54_007277 [Arachnomyces sp. PD_36]